MKVNNPYQARGTFIGQSYIERDADVELKEMIQDNNRYPYILAPRQSGKSSIMERARVILSNEDLKIVIIDLSSFPRNTLCNYDEFVFRFMSITCEKLVSNKLEKRLERLRNDPGFLLKSVNLLLQTLKGRIIVCIDELDAISESEIKDDFLSQIRALFNERTSLPLLKRIQFIFAATISQASLISNLKRSPFNVGTQIVLRDFNKEQVNKLLSVGNWLNPSEVEQASEKILYWTSGSVYLSQNILERLYTVKHKINEPRDISDLIDDVVTEIIESSAREIHFINIMGQLKAHPFLLSALNDWINGIVLPNRTIKELLILAGISDEATPIRNRIYRKVFFGKGALSLMPSRSMTDGICIIGREKQIDYFSKQVLDFDQAKVVNDNVMLICIWGFGGVGKTTLLKKFGEICDLQGWFITGRSINNSIIQIPHPAEPLSMFLRRIHRFENEPEADEFQTISRFVSSLPHRCAILIDEFRLEDEDFLKSFEWMISQMTAQAKHRYLIITTCRPRPRFSSTEVDYYVGAEQGLPPLTFEQTKEYIDYYHPDDLRNKYIREIFNITRGNPKVINYFYASLEISEKILSYKDSSTLGEADVIRATQEYVYKNESIRKIADLAAVVGMVSTACHNDIFDTMVENWHELKKVMLDRSLLEQVDLDTFKLHDLLRDYYYKSMGIEDRQQLHQKVGKYYEKIHQPIEALEHYIRSEYKEGIQQVYEAAHNVSERNSNYKSIIRMAEAYINIFGYKDEFDVDIITDLGMSYRVLTDYQSALLEFERALSLCNHINVPENSLKRAKILWGLGETYRRLDVYDESLEYYDKGLAIYRTYEGYCGKDGIAKSERGKSAVYKMVSRYGESIQGYVIANDMYKDIGDLEGQLYCERGIAAVNMLQGIYSQARNGYAHSLKLYRKTNNPRGIAYACWGYAESLRLQGEIESAISVYNEALDLSKKIGDEWSIIYLSLNLGECYRAKRDFAKAREWYELIKDLITYQESPVIQAHYLLAIAEVQRLVGKADIELYRQAEKLYQEVPIGLRWGVAHSRIGSHLAELRTLRAENKRSWEDRMQDIIAFCINNQLLEELKTAKIIMEERNPDELHPLSFP